MTELEDLVVTIHPTQVEDFIQNLEDQGACVVEAYDWVCLVSFTRPAVATVESVCLEMIYGMEDE